MQPAPYRLQQAIWTAFKVARPTTKSIPRPVLNQLSSHSPCLVRSHCTPLPYHRITKIHARFYSDEKKPDLERKIQDAQQRVGNSIESRADTVVNLPGPEADPLKKEQDETIIHTLPESSSIVHKSDGPVNTPSSATNFAEASPSEATATSSDSTATPRHDAADSSHGEQTTPRDPLPSQLAARYSHVRGKFTHFMDNFQTHVFTASRRLNDLTGYSSIEQLKKDIEAQEQAVRTARQDVKSTRDAYQQAIATRSDTQREVNDLLHRKHAWSPTDLERFTNLYRSDHANEQTEQRAHESLGQAEKAYEEASTKLSRSILARYHEEQVWSDKIRQMSTWGTWGLMGLNVLLFVIFQILIEPWRRRRLVTGFEEKVQEALREQTAENELRTIFHIKAAQQDASTIPGATTPEDTTSSATPLSAPAEAIASAIASIEEDPSLQEMAERSQIEQAVETAITAEVLSEAHPSATTHPPSAQEPIHDTQASSLQNTKPPFPTSPPSSASSYKDLPTTLGTRVRASVANATHYITSLFDDKSTVVTSRRDLTSKLLEGAFLGAAGTVTLFWLAGVGIARGR